MSIKPQKSVLDIKILGKEYKIGCAPELQRSLFEASQYLDSKMREIRDQNVVGLDRVAILAALHITHELLNRDSDAHQGNQSNKYIQERIQKLSDKVASILNSDDN